MITVLSYVYSEADAQRRASRRVSLRAPNHLLVGTSVSRLVERYLDLLSKPPKSDDQTPFLRMLWGAARGVPADATRPASQPEIPVKRLLLDLNVFLDVILDRPPDADVAAALWAAIERGQAHGMVPARGVTTISTCSRRLVTPRSPARAWNVSSAFCQHLGRLVEQGDAGTVRRLVGQPVRRPARKVHETAMREPANNARQHSNLGLEHLWANEPRASAT
jgi:predicted nucleic acid-binding protein